MSEEQIIGRKCFELIGRTSPCLRCASAQALETRQVTSIERHVPELDRWIDVTSIPILDSDGNVVLLVERLQDITDRKKAEERAHFDNHFRDLVAKASACFVQMGDNRSFDEAVDQALASLGQLFGVDRSYLFRFSEDLTTMDNTHEWCAEGITAQKDRIQKFPSDSMAWWKARMLERHPVQIPDVDALPAEAATEKEEFQSQGIQSLICLPICDDQKRLIAFFGFDAVGAPHLWPEEQVAMLQVLAEIIGSTIGRIEAIHSLSESQARLDKVVGAAQDAIVMLDPEGNISMWNAAAEQTFAYSSAEAMGQNLHKLLAPPRFHEAHHRGFAEFGRSGTGGAVGKVVELSALRKNGKEFPVELSLSSIQIKGSWHAVGILRDITDRKRAEDALKDERCRLANIIEGTHAGTWEWNVQSGKTVFNEIWAELLGYRLDELSPTDITTWEKLVHPDDVPRCREILEQHFAAERSDYDCEYRMKHKQGHCVWIQDRGRVVTRTAEGKPSMMFGTHTDITERK
ncbi:PAS domain S-box protein, partial [Anaerobaca lacustris]|nr:PAS domain S-box protein [Sedimentisphaerales bacterium M17dextr]